MTRARRELVGGWAIIAAIIIGSGLLTLLSMDAARVRDIHRELRADAAAVEAVRRMTGVPAAIAVIEARASAQEPGSLEWLIVDAGLKEGSLAGDVPARLLARPGTLLGFDAGRDGQSARAMFGMAVRLDGDLQLVIARPDISILHSNRGKGFTLVTMLLMALAVALLRNWQQERTDRRRIERIGEAMTLFLRGDWGIRIGEDGNDAIARIAGKTDEMLGLLQQQLGRNDLVAERIAHELRAPVAVLAEEFRASWDDAADSPLSEANARSAIAAIENLIGLIDAVLLLVGVREDSFKPVPVELGQLVSNVGSLFADAAEERALSITIEGPAATINGEPPLLEMMLVNLIDNAIKYSGRGGRILARVSVCPAGTTLTIDDEGPGLAGLPEHPGVLLARGPAGRGLAGSGIGLATAMRIAERHGAKLTFADRPEGRGLRVQVVFAAAALSPL